MEENEKKANPWYFIGLCVMVLTMIVGVIWFIIAYYNQESGITDKLDECSFYTIATPTEMLSRHNLVFEFYYRGQKHEDNNSVGYGDVGSYTMSSVLNKRYWVKVYCKDVYVNRIIWKHPVPDTLQYVPPEGWKDIPYGLWYKINEE